VATAWAMIYLANAYIKLKDYKKAQKLLEKNLTIYRKNYPANHDGLIRAMSFLTDAYMGLENYETAKPLLEETLLGVEQRYGEKHIKAAQILQNLGKIYFYEEEIESAEQSLHKALKIFLQNKDPESYICLELLADVSLKKSSIALSEGTEQQSQKFKKQAVDYLIKALAIIKANELESSPHIIRLQEKLNRLE
ncbi:MAG: tetratricopeptide repeat protein, partial [Alphaproteobacteria bacterium]|nr:tetratricopeptide repeat protein [Alphaproteobacteria bacterium]